MSQLQTKLQFRPRATLPMIFQDEIAECGHACIAMVSCFWGHALDLHAMRRRHKPSLRGVSLRDMTHLLDDLGFQTRALRVPLEEVHLMPCPAILHWNMNHFVVLKKVHKHHVTIHDPAVGVRRVSMEEFSQSFTGIVLEVTKSQHFTPTQDQTTLRLMDVISMMTNTKSCFWILFILSLSIEILSLIAPLFTQYVTDDVVVSHHMKNLIYMGIGFLGLMLMQALAEWSRSYMVIYFSMHVTEKYLSWVMNHLFKLPLSFFEARSKGDLQSKIHVIDDIKQKIGVDFINTLLDGLMIVLTITMMFFYSRILTLIVLATLLLFVCIRYMSYRVLKNQTSSSLYLHAKSSSIFLESLQAMTPIKSFLKERVRLSMWRNSMVDALNADIHIQRMQARYQVMNQMLSGVEQIVVLSIGASFILKSTLSLGMLFAFLTYRQCLVTKSSSFIQHVFDYQLLALQLNRLSDIVFHAPEVVTIGTGHKDAMRGELSLQNISFQYHPTSPMILNDINISIQQGEKVALVGPSGCGKSTLLKIAMGLLLPSSGKIWIDGCPLEEFGLKNYREAIASVMQEDALLSGSILNNITFFDDDVDLERMYRVAQLACIHDVIRQLPMGYETLVGEMGSTLSGGQKQRLLLARALYKEPKILFLDEATSHLDEAHERRINQALKSLNMTQVIIAHRQETIKMADRVIDLSVLS